MTIRFTATSDDYETRHFPDEDAFIAYLDTLWSTHSWHGGRRYQSEQLWTKEPDRYPCIMLVSGTMSNSDGPDWVLNHFLYDVEILDDNEEDAA